MNYYDTRNLMNEKLPDEVIKPVIDMIDSNIESAARKGYAFIEDTLTDNIKLMLAVKDHYECRSFKVSVDWRVNKITIDWT